MRFVPNLFAGIILAVPLVGAASASQLTYAPVNPTFGGNPLNGNYLLSTAQAQGKGRAASGAPDLSALNAAIANLASSFGTLNLNQLAPNPTIVITPTIPTNP